MVERLDRKPLKWVGSSRKDVRGFPRSVQRDIGVALYVAQIGEVHPDAKVLKGFSGASVLEVVSVDNSGTYRAVYSVRFEDAVYVLHAFQKKSKKGIETPKAEIDTVRRRLIEVERLRREKNK
jgi:phage-related protein